MGAKKHFSRLGWAYVVFFLVSTAMQLLTNLGLSLWEMAGWGRINMDLLILISQFSMYCVGFPIFLLLVKRVPAWKRTEERSLGAGGFVLNTIFCFGMTYLGNIAGQLLMAFAGILSGTRMENPVDIMVMEMSPWVMLLSTVIIAPVMEELMFRKFLIDRVAPYGQKTAVIVSGVGFGLFHGNFYQFFYACAIGMVFAYLYSSTGRIRYSIMLHMIINFMGGYVSLLLVQGVTERQVWAYLGAIVQSVFMIGSIICAIVLACVYGRRLGWFPAWIEIPERGVWKTILLAPGMIGFLAVSFVMFVIG